ncbi:adenine permease (plasmid) [Ralstonia solanacearum]|nr:adenine permease [Ralstonia solanacearum]
MSAGPRADGRAKLAHTRAQLRTTSWQLLRTYSNSYEAKRIGLIRAALASLTRQHLA